jgi:hypothetical protein
LVENKDLVADFHSILNMWKNYFHRLSSVHEVNDGSQTEIHTAEPLVPEPSSSEVGIVIGKLKKYKSPSRSEIHKLINCVWNKDELPEQ